MNSKFWSRWLPLALSAAMTLLLFQNCGKSFQTVETESSNSIFRSPEPEGLDLTHGKIFLITKKMTGAVRNVMEASVYLEFNTITTRQTDPLCFGQSHLNASSRDAFEAKVLELESQQAQIAAEIAGRAAGSDIQILVFADSGASYVTNQIPAGDQLLVGSNSAVKSFLDSYAANPQSVACQ